MHDVDCFEENSPSVLYFHLGVASGFVEARAIMTTRGGHRYLFVSLGIPKIFPQHTINSVFPCDRTYCCAPFVVAVLRHQEQPIIPCVREVSGLHALANTPSRLG